MNDAAINNRKVTIGSAALSAAECVEQQLQGKLEAEQLLNDCLQVIDASEKDLQAWQFLSRDSALAQARTCDERRKRSLPTGSLHGIPVGLKDIIDTADMPTERGSKIFAGRQPENDSWVAQRLREAGAIILGKTVTTDMAFMDESRTRNPHNLVYGPGGSSAGSAAAVGAGQVPLAVGTQTNGSVIRPASYCGIFGFKPSRGTIPRRGVLRTSNSLDQIGVYARNLDDIGLLTDALKGYEKSDPACAPVPKPAMLEGLRSAAPAPPNFAFIDMPYADRYSEAVEGGLDELVDTLEGQVDRIPAPRSFAALIKCHRLIYRYEMYQMLEEQRTGHWDKLSPALQAAMKDADSITEAAWQEALEVKQAAEDWFANFFLDYDAIITASAPSEAPRYGTGTGDPICNTIWTLCGLPCLSMPLMTGVNQMPIGVQLTGAFERDDRLLRTSRWLLDFLGQDPA